MVYPLLHLMPPPNLLEEIKEMEVVNYKKSQQAFPIDSSQCFHCNNMKHHLQGPLPPPTWCITEFKDSMKYIQVNNKNKSFLKGLQLLFILLVSLYNMKPTSPTL